MGVPGINEGIDVNRIDEIRDEDLRQAARDAMRELLGSGYIDEYYDDAANDFVGIAQWWASAQAAAAEARAVVAEAQVQRVENLCEVVRALQQPDPYTGDRDISFLAVRAALAGEEEA